MSKFHEYVASEKAMKKAIALGICKDESELKRTARLAGRVTHPDANHRYQDILLAIVDGEIRDVMRLSSEEAKRLRSRPHRQRLEDANREGAMASDAERKKAKESMKRASEEFGVSGSKGTKQQ